MDGVGLGFIGVALVGVQILVVLYLLSLLTRMAGALEGIQRAVEAISRREEGPEHSRQPGV